MFDLVDFRSGYVVPGVYVTSDNSTVASAVGISPTVICLIGPGVGYDSIQDVVTFASSSGSTLPNPTLTTSVALGKTGVVDSSIVVTATVAGTPTTFALTTDYTLSDSNAGSPESVTTLTLTGGTNIPLDTIITINYNYADDVYFAPNSFTDFSSFSSIYGTPFDPTTGAISSPLSLAAQIAFLNGANRIYAVALTSDGTTLENRYLEAYSLIQTNPDIDIVVPIFADGVGSFSNYGNAASFITDLQNHVDNTSDDNFKRIGIFGLPTNFAGTSPDQIAQQVADKRIVFAWPNSLQYFNPISSTTQNLGGSYLAAAYAGVFSSININDGLTRKQVRGFTGIPLAIQTTMTTTNKNTWSSLGVAVTETNRTGQLIVRHGVTTNTTSVVTREASIVRCDDAVFLVIDQSLEQAGLIGSPITSDTTVAVKSIITGALETALAAEIIQGYNSVLVRQQALPNGDPTVIECTFAYQPTYTLNYITVVISLDLTTGDTTTDTTTS